MSEADVDRIRAMSIDVRECSEAGDAGNDGERTDSDRHRGRKALPNTANSTNTAMRQADDLGEDGRRAPSVWSRSWR
jgi:hypothetical protein